MKILSNIEIRKADAYTITHEPIAAVDLMERAALGCTNWILNHFSKRKSFVVFSGPGNNGGDGLAIARQLAEKGKKISVVRMPGTFSECNVINFNRLKDFPSVKVIQVKDALQDEIGILLKSKPLVVDAILGAGISRPADGLYLELIQQVNESGCLIISIDIPSGLNPDSASAGSASGVIFAAHTLSLELPKLAFMFPQNESNTGHLHLIPIGLNKKFLNELAESKRYYTDIHLASGLLKSRTKFSHKGTYGHGLIIGGSEEKPGAAILAAGGCLRSGVGLLTVSIPSTAVTAMLSRYPEAMVHPHQETFSLPENWLDKTTAIGIGPGTGTDEKASAVLKKIIQEWKGPLVIDADGLNILAENKTWLSFLKPNTILTPHPKEFERLAGKTDDDFSRHQLALDLAFKYQSIIVLKGAHTLIACPDGRSFFNSTGNPGMASGGTGDVLSGIITGLLAQQYAPVSAAVLGVFLHGMAGDFAAEKEGEEGLVATDLIDFLGPSFKVLRAFRQNRNHE